MPIENIKKMVAQAKKQASTSLTDDWLSKAKEIKDIATSKMSFGGSYEKLPAAKLIAMQGSPEEPQILVVKAIGERHEVNTDHGPTTVFEVDVLFSEVAE